ncbi:MAG: DUF433 domain-containing protein [Armatimonadetes bacterium]|nr:DUF433 domain-containing protein [Armatimonadota bacterium]
MSIGEIVSEYPTLSCEDVLACLAYSRDKVVLTGHLTSGTWHITRDTCFRQECEE